MRYAVSPNAVHLNKLVAGISAPNKTKLSDYFLSGRDSPRRTRCAQLPKTGLYRPTTPCGGIRPNVRVARDSPKAPIADGTTSVTLRAQSSPTQIRALMGTPAKDDASTVLTLLSAQPYSPHCRAKFERGLALGGRYLSQSPPGRCGCPDRRRPRCRKTSR
jgi:hypothetical protein